MLGTSSPVFIVWRNCPPPKRKAKISWTPNKESAMFFLKNMLISLVGKYEKVLSAHYELKQYISIFLVKSQWFEGTLRVTKNKACIGLV